MPESAGARGCTPPGQALTRNKALTRELDSGGLPREEVPVSIFRATATPSR